MQLFLDRVNENIRIVVWVHTEKTAQSKNGSVSYNYCS